MQGVAMDSIAGDEQRAVNVEEISVKIHPAKIVKFCCCCLNLKFAHDCSCDSWKPEARSLSHHQASDVSRQAGSLIAIYNDRAQSDIAGCRFESRRHVAEKLAND